jgi:nitrogen fixation/metabolism regulation signal transduction histidine kinase
MKHLPYERRILLAAFLAGLPGSFVGLLLLWTGDFSSRTQWTVTLLVAGLWLGFSFAAADRVVFPLRTISNLLSALREGDFSIRARGARAEDSLGEVFREANALQATLRQQRLGALEAAALLRKVIEEIDAAIFAFDANGRLRLVNRAGERLLNQASARLLLKTAGELGLEECLKGETPRTAEMWFPRGSGRWEVHRSSFRQEGMPMELVVITDLSRALREEERQAWQRLIRVLGHELNNSLAPIKSVAESLRSLMRRTTSSSDGREDMEHGLEIIATRAEALSRFMTAYSRLARLPPPRLQPIEIGGLIRRVASLETRLPVGLEEGTPLTVRADPDQLEQLLINVLRNAVDAALETGGSAGVTWSKKGAFLEVSIEDEGPGLPETTNLFVPFFTTKPHGSGIGLVLSRQIAEAHGGSLSLQNRHAGHGCVARLRIPVESASLGPRRSVN